MCRLILNKFTRVLVSTILIVQWVVMPAYCVPTLSDGKFLYRIEKKQELLIFLGQDVEEFKDMYERIRELLLKLEAAAIFEKEVLSLSDKRYISRCEKKLGLIVNESIKDVESVFQPAGESMMMDHLMPESKFDSLDVEKELMKEEKNKK